MKKNNNIKVIRYYGKEDINDILKKIIKIYAINTNDCLNNKKGKKNI